MSLSKRSWRVLWKALGGGGNPDDVIFDIQNRYAEPHRKYHTIQHLEECLDTFQQVKALAQHPAAVEMALLFHDVIYDVHRHDNEFESAELADRWLTKGSVKREVIDRIKSLILVTQHSNVPQDADECLLVDIDLAILGADAERFWEYDQQIRQEYAFVPETLYNQKRYEILNGFLLRPSIYSTQYFQEFLEIRARENLQSLIAKLG
jgi:predicted metal-dependent HD superfamily phosphohydrolase